MESCTKGYKPLHAVGTAQCWEFWKLAILVHVLILQSSKGAQVKEATKLDRHVSPAVAIVEPWNDDWLRLNINKVKTNGRR